jgi:hypothetical protein
MQTLILRRHVVSISVATALLVSCVSERPLTSVPSMPQGAAVATSTSGRASWTAREAKSDDLLYVANVDNGTGGSVIVYRYPDGKLVGDLTGFERPNGLCVDKAGNIYVANFAGETIVEYAHGGSKPIATLSDDGTPNGCAIDPRSGDLAVTNWCDGPIGSCYASGTVLIYTDAKGLPKKFTDSNIPTMLYCAYDHAGNLFVDGSNGADTTDLAELPKGDTTFTGIQLSLPKKTFQLGGLQWDQGDLAIAPGDGNAVYQYTVSKGRTTLIHTTPLLSIANGNGTNQFWIIGRTIIAEEMSTRKSDGMVKLFPYPAGGQPSDIIAKSVNNPWAAVVSPAKP